MSKEWALVTGASRGIGRAIAIELAGTGLHVVVNCRSQVEAAREVVATIERAGGSAEVVRFDVALAEPTRVAIETLLERLGAPHVLVNNAGIKRDNLMVWMEEEDWRAVIDTNLGGFFHVTQPCLKAMLTARKGRIINITSTAGQLGNAGQVNYSASKAGLIGATKALALEIAPRGITVNAVAPGFVETDMTAELPPARIKTIPAGRLGAPEEVAAVVRFLASDAATYVTGQVVAVNGGIV